MSFMLAKDLIKVSSLSGYIAWVIVFSILIRIIMNIFKMLAVKLGEAEELDKNGVVVTTFKDKWGRWKTFWILFGSCGGHANLDDFFLPTILGLFELLFFPTIILVGKWEFIGFWLTIKTAAHWIRWKESRTPYMRFLLGNVLMLFAAFILSNFLVIVK